MLTRGTYYGQRNKKVKVEKCQGGEKVSNARRAEEAVDNDERLDYVIGATLYQFVSRPREGGELLDDNIVYPFIKLATLILHTRLFFQFTCVLFFASTFYARGQ
jgi:hypothetical protein